MKGFEGLARPLCWGSGRRPPPDGVLATADGQSRAIDAVVELDAALGSQPPERDADPPEVAFVGHPDGADFAGGDVVEDLGLAGIDLPPRSPRGQRVERLARRLTYSVLPAPLVALCPGCMRASIVTENAHAKLGKKRLILDLGRASGARPSWASPSD